ncbi:thiamine biosynthesis protein ThiF [bacterium]|nr:thiamine biosynthesis protein ThiF [bacterium]MBU1883991.1 thiamine biosynthesis protein ThiF [bacterium]
MDLKEIEQFEPTSWCEGIIGDGCGGGRIFFTCKDSLNVYDPITKMSRILLDGLDDPKELSKKGCHLFFTCKDEKMTFDLSKMALV